MYAHFAPLTLAIFSKVPWIAPANNTYIKQASDTTPVRKEGRKDPGSRIWPTKSEQRPRQTTEIVKNMHAPCQVAESTRSHLSLKPLQTSEIAFWNRHYGAKAPIQGRIEQTVQRRARVCVCRDRGRRRRVFWGPTSFTLVATVLLLSKHKDNQPRTCCDNNARLLLAFTVKSVNCR